MWLLWHTYLPTRPAVAHIANWLPLQDSSQNVLHADLAHEPILVVKESHRCHIRAVDRHHHDLQ